MTPDTQPTPAPTPRTDGKKFLAETTTPSGPFEHEVVLASDYAELERELTSAQAALAAKDREIARHQEGTVIDLHGNRHLCSMPLALACAGFVQELEDTKRKLEHARGELRNSYSGEVIGARLRDYEAMKTRAEKAEAELAEARLYQQNNYEGLKAAWAERDQLRAEVDRLTTELKLEKESYFLLENRVMHAANSKEARSACEQMMRERFDQERSETIQNLRAQLAAAKEDTERLDWLERFLRTGNTSLSCDSTGEIKDTDFVYENGALLDVFSGHYSIGYQYETEHRGCYSWRELGGKRKRNRIRAALDAARKAQP